jgi:hypothetical protein
MKGLMSAIASTQSRFEAFIHEVQEKISPDVVVKCWEIFRKYLTVDNTPESRCIIHNEERIFNRFVVSSLPRNDRAPYDRLQEESGQLQIEKKKEFTDLEYLRLLYALPESSNFRKEGLEEIKTSFEKEFRRQATEEEIKLMAEYPGAASGNQTATENDKTAPFELEKSILDKALQSPYKSEKSRLSLKGPRESAENPIVTRVEQFKRELEAFFKNQQGVLLEQGAVITYATISQPEKFHTVSLHRKTPAQGPLLLGF